MPGIARLGKIFFCFQKTGNQDSLKKLSKAVYGKTPGTAGCFVLQISNNLNGFVQTVNTDVLTAFFFFSIQGPGETFCSGNFETACT